MTVRVRFLGSGPAFADGGRSHACILVKGERATILLDCGASALPAIRTATRIGEIDAIAITHLHGDHFGALPFFVMAEHYLGRKHPLVLAGPPSLAERWKRAAGALYADFDWDKVVFPIDVRPLSADERELSNGATLSAVPVTHVPASEPHGLRLRLDGKVIAYSGDAAWSDALPRLADGADLFICESTWWDFTDPVHLSAADLRKHRGELRAKRTVVTHLTSQAQEHLDDLVFEPARDGLELTL